MNNIIMVFGTFLNDIPYFALAIMLGWSHLRYGRGHAYMVMAGATVLHAISVLIVTALLPPETMDKIIMPHELVFFAVFIGAFVWTVRIDPARLLFVAFFIKSFADLTTTLAVRLEKILFHYEEQRVFHDFFGFYYNAAHLIVLCTMGVLMYFFVKRILLELYLVESKIWRFLWLIPAAFFGLSFSDEASRGILFAVSIAVYILILETLRATKEKVFAEESEKRHAEKAEFYNTMAHELLTPLTRVSTNVQTAMTRPQEANELLSNSQAEIMAMAEMINRALDEAEKGGGPHEDHFVR